MAVRPHSQSSIIKWHILKLSRVQIWNKSSSVTQETKQLYSNKWSNHRLKFVKVDLEMQQDLAKTSRRQLMAFNNSWLWARTICNYLYLSTSWPTMNILASSMRLQAVLQLSHSKVRNRAVTYPLFQPHKIFLTTRVSTSWYPHSSNNWNRFRTSTPCGRAANHRMQTSNLYSQTQNLKAR